MLGVLLLIFLKKIEFYDVVVIIVVVVVDFGFVETRGGLLLLTML